MKFIKRALKKIIFYFIKPEIDIVYSSYSQAGEDAIIKMLFDNVNIKTPTYLDIGVCHPADNDNTYLFYKTGSHGVCVEANPALINHIKSARPKDQVLNVGVGDTSAGETDFYTFEDPNLNTFDREEALRREKLGIASTGIVKVPIRSINEIIRDNFSKYPDFISLDIEGLDLDVLKALDYKRYPIPVICVETCSYSETHIKPKLPHFNTVMEHAGYFIFADTYINTIYANRDWFYSIHKTSTVSS